MKVTAANLIRWAGLSAMLAGGLFVIIQPLHPADTIASVGTDRWAIIHYVSIAMCLSGLIGLAGLYARQIERAGWLGLVGYLLFSLFYLINMAYQFVEAFVAPLLVTDAPTFLGGFLGIVSGQTGGVDLGPLPALYMVSGVLYLFAPLLFGVAIFRAGILPRWTGVFLACVGPLSALLAALLPHEIERIAAVPVGFALICLGYALWSERQEYAAKLVLSNSGV